MALAVHFFRCRSDNIGLLVRSAETGETMLVDAPEEGPILTEIEATGWLPSAVLVTHHHSDHVAAIPALKDRFGVRVLGPAAEADRIPGIDELLADGQVVHLLGEEMYVIATPGHTRGHLSYHFPASGQVFTGDTLFALGCGRLSECGPAEMLSSLTRLRALPPETVVWCGHDYLDKNARFALTVDSGNDALRGRANHAVSMRAAGTLAPPSTIGEERATNPFLRWDNAAVRATLVMKDANDLDVFTELRQRRNVF